MTILRMTSLFILLVSVTTELASGGPSKREISNGTDIDADTGVVEHSTSYVMEEVCRGTHNYESMKSAIHQVTNLAVDLYFYAGYSQWFQLGECVARQPRIKISENIRSYCDVAYTAVKAWVVIDPETFPQVDKVKNCGKVKDLTHLVCNDWIMIPTHCKLYFEG